MTARGIAYDFRGLVSTDFPLTVWIPFLRIDRKITDTFMSSELMAELQEAAEKAASSLHDPDAANKACEGMDRLREEFARGTAFSISAHPRSASFATHEVRPRFVCSVQVACRRGRHGDSA
jgi:hypothetical protein